MLLWFWGSSKKKAFYGRKKLKLHQFLALMGDDGKDEQTSMTIASQKIALKASATKLKRVRGAAFSSLQWGLNFERAWFPFLGFRITQFTLVTRSHHTEFSVSWHTTSLKEGQSRFSMTSMFGRPGMDPQHAGFTCPGGECASPAASWEDRAPLYASYAKERVLSICCVRCACFMAKWVFANLRKGKIKSRAAEGVTRMKVRLCFVWCWQGKVLFCDIFKRSVGQGGFSLQPWSVFAQAWACTMGRTSTECPRCCCRWCRARPSSTRSTSSSPTASCPFPRSSPRSASLSSSWASQASTTLLPGEG